MDSGIWLLIIVGAIFILVMIVGATANANGADLFQKAQRCVTLGDLRGAMRLLGRNVSFAGSADDADRLRMELAERFAREGHRAEAHRLLSIVDANLKALESRVEVSGKQFAKSRAYDRAEKMVEAALAAAAAHAKPRASPPATAAAPIAIATETALAAGASVGPYVVESLIAEGGFSQVWRAREVSSGTAVALKIPTKASYVEVLKSQGQIQSRFHDPRIVAIVGADLHSSPPYIAMELVLGEDLRAILRREQRLAPLRAAQILTEILRAVAVAHRAGIIHRDLKPENAIVAAGDRVKVTDFHLGEARERTERPLQRSQGLETAADSGAIGTPAYMAPEQLGGEPVDARADIYALGIIYFEMLTGKRPQPGDRLQDFVTGLPASCERIFQRCYTRLEKRFASADEMIAELEREPIA